jgi:hypothetical protein
MAAPTTTGTALRVLSLTSRFYHPAVAMAGWDVLSRASAFAVAARSPDAPVRHHLVVSAHVVRPFLFPAYYPADRYPFLEVLGDDDIRCAVEVRDAAGRPLAEVPLAGRIYVHPRRDIAVAHVADQAQLDAALAAAGATLQPVTLAAAPAGERQPLRFEGHVLRPLPPSAAGSTVAAAAAAAVDVETALMLPTTVDGALLARSDAQTFATTGSAVLEMGMCGGPVLQLLRADDDGTGVGECVGVVEGVVPPAPAQEQHACRNGGGPPGGDGGDCDHDGGCGHQHNTPQAPARADESPAAKAARLLAGSAVYIEAAEVAAFVAAVERQMLR